MTRADEGGEAARAPDVDLRGLRDVLGLLASKWSVRVLDARERSGHEHLNGDHLHGDQDATSGGPP